MDIETMKTFLVLVDTKNFTRTAHQLFIAQSTVTNRILELEKELNVTLFERNNRSVELTPAGERIFVVRGECDPADGYGDGGDQFHS